MTDDPPVTAVEWLALIRSGAEAFHTGQPSTAVPYRITRSAWAAARGEIWLRGWVLARAGLIPVVP